MSLSARRMRSIGWLALLAFCATLVLVLTLRVNALRSQVRREENRIIALREETIYLQTEFETRASQQQLKAWNDVDFGYVAPAAGQYLENERQLASLGKPAGPDAPAPVRLAELGDGDAAVTPASVTGAGIAAAGFPSPGFASIVSPLTGKPTPGAVRSDAVSRNLADNAAAGHAGGDHDAAAAALGERLGHVDRGEGKATHAKLKKPARKPKPEAPKSKSATRPKPAARPKAKTPASARKARPHAAEDQA